MVTSVARMMLTSNTFQMSFKTDPRKIRNNLNPDGLLRTIIG
jgi:hypothetical protein